MFSQQEVIITLDEAPAEFKTKTQRLSGNSKMPVRRIETRTHVSPAGEAKGVSQSSARRPEFTWVSFQPCFSLSQLIM